MKEISSTIDSANLTLAEFNKTIDSVNALFKTISEPLAKLSTEEKARYEDSIKILKERYELEKSLFNPEKATKEEINNFKAEIKDISEKLIELNDKIVKISEKDKNRWTAIICTVVASLASVGIVVIVKKH